MFHPSVVSLAPILTIDDDPDDLFILKRLLSKGGVTNKVVAFEDGVAARAYLDIESRQPRSLYLPCIVFTDLHMPRMNGFEFVAWIRSQPTLQDLPVIVVSSSEAPGDRRRAEAVGATAFLTKYPTAATLRQLSDEFGCSRA